jgi:glycosyltransferase involved in cell wall biosynthesis
VKILICSDHFYPDLSSGGRLLTDLAQGLVSSDEIAVITAFSTYNAEKSLLPQENYMGIQISRVFSTSLPRKNLIGRLINEISFCLSSTFKILFMPKFDVILVLSSPPFLPIFVSFVARLRGIPYLYVMMDVFPDIAVSTGLAKPGSVIIVFWEFLSKISLSHAKRIVVLGRCMKSVVQQKISSQIKIPIDVIHNWSDGRFIYPIDRLQNSFFSQYPNLKDKFIVMYSGNLGRFQDFETILASADALKSETQVQFVISGEGARKDWLLEQIASRDLHNVSLLPFVPQSELNNSLNAADVGLVTLEPGAEGLGVPSKFYPLLAAGTPVIALMAGHAEVALQVSEADIGFVVTQGDAQGLVNAISALVSDPARQRLFSQRARDLFLERFDRKIAIEVYRLALERTASS